jgi:thiol-disulfide isomerase/thioredoxin
MNRMLQLFSITLALSLFALPALAQYRGYPALPPPPAEPADLAGQVRVAVSTGDFAAAEAIVNAARRDDGLTPAVLLAHSWIGRGAVGAGDFARAERMGQQTYDLATQLLRGREIDEEPMLPTALGAAIEVIGHARAGRGAISDAVIYLTRQHELYADTSMAMRIQKNLNLVSLEGTTAPALDLSEYQGVTPPTLDDLKGRVLVLFFWAHWCPDCKQQGPVLEQLLAKYEAQGLSVVAPTQRYGYAAAGARVGPDEEARYIAQVREASYPWLANIPVPMTAANHQQYGVSTTPTLVIVDREGVVRRYNPGRLTMEQIEPLVRELL